MNFILKTFSKLACFLWAIALFYFLLLATQEHIIRAAARRAVNMPITEGIDLDSLSFFNFSMKNPRVAKIGVLSTRVEFDSNIFPDLPDIWNFKLNDVHLRFDGFLLTGIINLNTGEIELISDLDPVMLRNRQRNKMKIQEIEISSSGISMQVPLIGIFQRLQQSLRAWNAGEAADLTIVFSFDLKFFLNETPLKLRIYTEKDIFGRTVLLADKDDIRRCAKYSRENLTEAEVDIFHRLPLQAPRFLQIKQTAESESLDLEGERIITSAQGEAYRHILWSYLMAEAFGVEMAEKIGNAHEDFPDNDPREKQRDLQNNSLGREYFLKGISRDRLLETMLEDPRADINN